MKVLVWLVHRLHMRICPHSHYCSSCGDEVIPTMQRWYTDWTLAETCHILHPRDEFGITWRYSDQGHEHASTITEVVK